MGPRDFAVKCVMALACEELRTAQGNANGLVTSRYGISIFEILPFFRYRDGNFVVLNQVARLCGGAPFYRGFPETSAAVEKKPADADRPGGALDSPFQGSPIYLGRPYGGKNPQPHIHEY